MAKRLARFGLLVALCFVFSYLEFLLPLPFGVPGMKLGLSNLVVLVALYSGGPLTAGAVSLVRILLNGFTFGTPLGMLYSIAGGVLSFLSMWLLYKIRHFSPVGVSILGGILHNIGQLSMAFALLGVAGLIYYAPILLISGAVAGFLVGLVASAVLPRLKGVWGRMG